MFQGKNVAIYVTGGIAAYKAANFVRLLIKEGATVQVSMTAAACKFVTPLTFQVLTKQAVHLDTFDERVPQEVQHIQLADWTDVAVVIPATANTIAKMANGIADNFVTSALLATTAPTFVVPAMNEHMWENPTTRRNIAQLRQDGVRVIEPVVGFLAEGYQGKGRLPESEQVLKHIGFELARQTTPQLLKRKKILITAGGTKERIDPVRYITNDSSGKMGYALAQSAAEFGGEVYLISTNRQLPIPEGVAVTYVESAEEMSHEVMQMFPEMDIAVMVAAVSDYHVKERAPQKLKKQEGQDELTLTLLKNPDILKQLGYMKQSHQQVIGFAAETEHVIDYATKKLFQKKADAIIANDVSDTEIGFNSDTHQVTILTKEGKKIALPRVSKTELASKIWLALLEEI